MIIFFKDIKKILEEYKDDGILEPIKEIVSSLDINEYISVVKKYAIANNFQKQISEIITGSGEVTDIDMQGYYLTYDIELLFLVLNTYVGVITSIDERTVENYDLIKSTGFFDLVTEKCRNDINEFKCIVDRICGINNAWILSELNDIFCQTTNVTNMERIADIINNQVDKETLDKMQAISLMTDPSVNKMVDKLKKEASDEVMNRK